MAILGAYIVPHPPIIIPSIGKGEEAKIQKTVDAYDRAAREIAELNPDTVVVTTPHSVLYADYLHISPGESASGDFRAFGSRDDPLSFRYDTEFVRGLTGAAKRAGIPAGTFGERDSSIDHGTLVPLSFLHKYCGDFRLVRCSLSGFGPLVHYNYGKCIADTAERLGRRAVLVASGDLSHKLKEDGPYGFAPEGPQFDAQVTKAMAEGDFMRFLTFDEEFCDAAAECGLRSFIIMAGAFDGIAVEPEFLSYEGPFGVGYAVCGFRPKGPDGSRRFGERYEKWNRERADGRKKNEDEYVRLARLSLETKVRENRSAVLPDGLSPELTERKSGVFVSLKKEGRLRGCIGTIRPVRDSIAEEIVQNAVSAGTEDPRFDPVTEDELPELVYSVDVLGDTEPIASLSELDPERYGVVVRNGGRCGLLLPDLAGIDSPEQQVSIALQKAGIRKNEPYRMERFEVVRHT